MASRTALTTFRLATINVHAFQSANTNTNNVHDLVSILKPHNFDLLAVEEVYNDENWPKFCESLSLKYFIFVATYGRFHGNGIASRHPIKSHSNQPASFSCAGGKRSILQCRLGGDHPFVKDRIFAVTHLDHMNEDDRLKQIHEFNPHKQNIDILIGDMNALTRDDYSENYYQNIVAGKRKASGWEKPRFEVTEFIRDELKYQDALKLINPELKDEQVATCPYGTRIDYIYVHPCVNDQWTIAECSIINAQPATDHNCVMAVFQQIEDEDT